MANKITYDNKVAVNPQTVHINQFWAEDANELKDKHNLNDDRTTANENSIVSLTAGQSGGFKSFTTLALLQAYPTPDINDGYKVTNDPTSSNNGYYHYVSGTTYVLDGGLVNGIIESGNADAVSGGTVFTAIEDFGAPTGIIESGNAEAVSGGTVNDFILNEFNLYPFLKDTDLLTYTDELANFLIDVEIDDANADEFHIHRIKRNATTTWEVQFRKTSDPLGDRGAFLTGTNPETSGTQIHEFNDGTITGRIAVDWSKLTDGFSWTPFTDITLAVLSSDIYKKDFDRIFKFIPKFVDVYENSLSEYTSKITLDRDRIFNYYDVSADVNIDLTGVAISGKVLVYELSHNVTNVIFSMPIRIQSGVFDTLTTGNSNFIYVMYVSDELIDVVFKQGASTSARVLSAIPTSAIVSYDKFSIGIEFSKTLLATLPSVYDFELSNGQEVSSVSILSNVLTLNFDTELPNSEDLHIKYNNSGLLQDSASIVIDSFVNKLSYYRLFEDWLTDTIGAGLPYSWTTTGTVDSHSSDGNVLTITGSGGIRSNGKLSLLKDGDIIEIRYRSTNSTNPLRWFSEESAYENFSNKVIVLNEWVIVRRVYRKNRGINTNWLSVSSIAGTIYEIDYIKFIGK